MRTVKTTLVVAWFVGLAVLLVCMFLNMAAGRQVVSDLFIGTAVGAQSLITGLCIILFTTAGENGSGVLGFVLSIGSFALGVVFLSAGGLLPETVVPWAAGVFLTWLALMFLAVWVAPYAVAQQARKNSPASALPLRAQHWPP
jgi:hypothetical protein